MARMGQDGYTDAETGQTKVTARCPEPLKEQFRDACDELGKSMTEVLKAEMREVVAEVQGQETASPLPDEPKLAAAYRALLEHDPERGHLDTEAAETIAAEAANVPKTVVRETVLKPLERRENIHPNWGTVIVAPPQTE